MDDREVTGRDGYLIMKAVFYAAHFIDGLPLQFRAMSDRAEMMKLLRARLAEGFEKTAERYGRELQEATGRPFDADADSLSHHFATTASPSRVGRFAFSRPRVAIAAMHERLLRLL